MKDVYITDEALLRDYHRLPKEYQDKAGTYIKNLLRLYRMETGLDTQILKFKKAEIKVFGMGKIRCSFCGQSDDYLSHIIAGPNVYICEDCVSVCDAVLEDVKQEESDQPN
jgi:hypothetical protein